MFAKENSKTETNGLAYKRVPALDKCFAMLGLMARTKRPMGISDLSNGLGYHKSTVFNTVHTLVDLGVLDATPEGKFRFGPRLYALGKAAGTGSDVVSTVRPYLEKLAETTRLSVFLGIRSGNKAIIMDKVDSPVDIKVSSEAGMAIPLMAGAGGKVLLSKLTDGDLDRMLKENPITRFTPASCTDKRRYKALIKKAREERFALDDEEYIEGIRAIAVPVHLHRERVEAAIWAVGLKAQIKDEEIPALRSLLLDVAEKIETRLWIGG